MSKREHKQPQTCQNKDCIGYMGTVYINGEEYRKCPTCQYMYKVNKRAIKPIGEK